MVQYNNRSYNSLVRLRVIHALVRFDNVPKNIVSSVLERTVLNDPGDILEWEYNFRRSIPAPTFWARLQSDMEGRLGREILRLRKHKLLPVLYVDIIPREYHMFYMQLSRFAVQRLAAKKSGFVLCRRDRESSGAIVEIPAPIIALLARNKFGIEIA